ncbi:lysophospholipid acyltransferase family protein [Tengunoibacter tsumagoiensis]|uniref:Glycerol acyltransferase n=1 Tax=Tengunoibacter tsumagoiensis TaxID=2014871 RepID=A0A402A4M1_9CHLR|nr:lysophospholipid acyltransferase family protein [Tengunoibacter tsumagoiensis]GCE14009.1 glycerol acyltransferase [Tengunoibacter tsumagoiensis]
MITAAKFPPGSWLVWRLIHSSLSKHFDRVYFRMEHELTPEHLQRPMIICANHFSWWDGYVAALLQKQLKLDGYLMMEEAQLKRYFFFRWIGCFSVDREHPRAAMQSLHYAARLFAEKPSRMVWIFPQGVIRPNDARPLTFFTGAAHLSRLAAPAYLYPLASRIEYMAEQRPNLFISMGSPLLITKESSAQPEFLKQTTHQLETLVTAELDRLRADILSGELTNFTQLMHGRASANRIFDLFLLRKQMKRL